MIINTGLFRGHPIICNLTNSPLCILPVFVSLQELEQDDDDKYLNAAWSDSGRMKRQVHGLDDVHFRYGN